MKKKNNKIKNNKKSSKKKTNTSIKTTPKNNNSKKVNQKKVELIKKEQELLMQNYKMKRKRSLAIILIFLLCLIIILVVNVRAYNTPPIITGITYSKEYNDDKTMDVDINIKKYNLNSVYCMLDDGENKSDWILMQDGACTTKITSGEYKITLKYNSNKTVEYKEKFNIDGIIGIKENNKNKYITKGTGYHLNTELIYIGDVDTKIEYSSSNPDAVLVTEDGYLSAEGVGTTTITIKASNGMTDSFDLTSTDLLRPPIEDNNKPKVPCDRYTDEEIALLDDILASRIEKAGEGTRGAAVEASRFLALDFPYLVPYFYENGRLTTDGVDGEGRYYHKGLYLGHEKEKLMTKSLAGPAAWGCPLMNYEDDGYRTPNTLYPNGLDCSGFVSWTLRNAGLDLGDIGSGISYSYDYSDVGPLHRDMYDFVTSGQAKPGDLIGWDGHIAIIAAIDDSRVYVVESLTHGVEMFDFEYTYPYSRLYSRYEFIIDMTENYNGEGIYSRMW